MKFYCEFALSSSRQDGNLEVLVSKNELWGYVYGEKVHGKLLVLINPAGNLVWDDSENGNDNVKKQ